MSSPYAHSISGDTIRLFRLQLLVDGVVSVSLQAFSLSADDCPPFIATSYVWGSPDSVTPILLNGRHTSVLQSAHALLSEMASPHRQQDFPAETTWWWMDSICINQTDKTERSAQVSLMGKIYKDAARAVVIWLGEESDDSATAIRFLHDVGSDRGFNPSASHEIRGNKDGWRAVGNLLSREWWGRVWTLQEFLVSQDAAFHCGRHSISREDMFFGICGVWSWQQVDQNLIQRSRYEKAWNRFRLWEWYLRLQDNLPLVGTLAYTADTVATYPSDRLYSLLGIATERDRGVIGSPDYYSPPGLVYARFVQSFIETHRSLDLICLAPWLRSNGSSRPTPPGEATEEGRLPSWVPDWSVRLSFSPPVPCMASVGTHIGNMRPPSSGDSSTAYAACGDRLPLVAFSDNLREMTCSGALLGYIDGLGGVQEVRRSPEDGVQSTAPANIRSSGPSAGPKTTASATVDRECSLIVDAITRCLVLDRADRYLLHPAPTGAFSEDFRLLCRRAARDPRVVFPTFATWFEQNRNLLIRGHELEGLVLGDSRHAPTEREERAAPVAPDWKSFVARSRDTTCHMGKRLVVTDLGLLGMAPREARKGDAVCVLFGCNIPLALRPVHQEAGTFEIIGECYVDGKMNGEVLKEISAGKLMARDFCLI